MSLSRTQLTAILAIVVLAAVGFAAAWVYEREQANSVTLSIGDQKLKIKTQ